MIPALVWADSKGRIFDEPALAAAGMKGGRFFRLKPSDLIPLPRGTEFFVLPARRAVGWEGPAGSPVQMEHSARPVSVFLPPGYAVAYNAAYKEEEKACTLPLFSYAACAFMKGRFYAAAFRVDPDSRHDPDKLDFRRVQSNIRGLRKRFSGNRVFDQLVLCAIRNGCANAKNFFLGRFEAPLPVSRACNARCQGCISYQPEKEFSATQQRLSFRPTPRELAEIALFHLERTRRGIVSFGQGCEGEPLTEGSIVEETIRLVRRRTSRGTIHMNTNGSRPEVLSRLREAGLDSVRISLNSAQPNFYHAYYRPRNYTFADVRRSLREGKRRGLFVSINYLTLPGFTDSEREVACFEKLLESVRPDCVQWRNLNYDPLRYFDRIRSPRGVGTVGIREWVEKLKRRFKGLRIGYFNPAAHK